MAKKAARNQARNQVEKAGPRVGWRSTFPLHYTKRLQADMKRFLTNDEPSNLEER